VVVADLAGQLMEEVDELVIKTYPLVLGSGMPMFAADFALGEFTLEAMETFGNGVIIRKYDRKR
jgi:dihydrofolate reductase